MLLRRFRGPNGIFQLIALLESSSEERQHELLTSLASENPGLASLIKTKVLTPAHIFSWDEKTLEPLFDDLVESPDDFLGGLLAILQKENQKGSASAAQALGAFVRGLEPRLGKSRFANLRAVASKLAATAQNVAVLDGVRTLLLVKVREFERTGVLKIAAFDPPKAMVTESPTPSSNHAA